MATDEIQVEIWKKTVDVQQHFNDLELRIRNFALAVLGAFLALGGSALKDGGTIHIYGLNISTAGLIILTSLVPLLAFYVMDRLWYHRLLYGAVEAAVAQEAALESAGYKVGLGTKISHHSAMKMWVTKWEIRSTAKMDIFYLILAATVLIIGLSVGFWARPQSPDTARESRPSIALRDGQTLTIKASREQQNPPPEVRRHAPERREPAT